MRNIDSNAGERKVELELWNLLYNKVRKGGGAKKEDGCMCFH